jgi:hypothetical protein
MTNSGLVVDFTCCFQCPHVHLSTNVWGWAKKGPARNFRFMWEGCFLVLMTNPFTPATFADGGHAQGAIAHPHGWAFGLKLVLSWKRRRTFGKAIITRLQGGDAQRQ